MSIAERAETTQLVLREQTMREVPAIAFDDKKLNFIKKHFNFRADESYEFEFFIASAIKYGLDPMIGQIFSVPRDGKRQIQVGIHGLRALAAKSGRYRAGKKAEFTYNSDGSIKSAIAYVRYLEDDGSLTEVDEEVEWSEYAQYKKDGRLQALWYSKPKVMLAKCAEAMALRRAFPFMGNIYIPEEMGSSEEEMKEKLDKDLSSNIETVEINAIIKLDDEMLLHFAREINGKLALLPANDRFSIEPTMLAKYLAYLQDSREEPVRVRIEKCLKANPAMLRECFNVWYVKHNQEIVDCVDRK